MFHHLLKRYCDLVRANVEQAVGEAVQQGTVDAFGRLGIDVVQQGDASVVTITSMPAQQSVEASENSPPAALPAPQNLPTAPRKRGRPRKYTDYGDANRS